MGLDKEVSVEKLSLTEDLEKWIPRPYETMVAEAGGEQQLISLLVGDIENILARCKQNVGVVYDWVLDESFFRLYEGYLCADKLPDLGLSDFESFKEVWLKDLDGRSEGNFVEKMGMFMEKVVHPYRMVQYWAKDLRSRDALNKMVLYKGEWCILPTTEEGVFLEMVDRLVVEEAIKIIDDDCEIFPDLYHVTGGCVLDEILQDRELKSGNLLVEEGRGAKVGEAYRAFGLRAEEQAGTILSLGNVYADRGLNYGGYSTVRWFDEYPVGFGIDQDAMERYLRSQGRDPGSVIRETSRGGGTVLGERVPLEGVIKVIYCMEINKNEVEEKLKKNGVDIPVVSFESYNLIRFFDARYKFRDKPREMIQDWGKFLKESKKETL